MLQVIDLRSDHIEIVEQILAEYVLDCEVYAFGSRVRGKVKPHSDLDLVVRGHAPYHEASWLTPGSVCRIKLADASRCAATGSLR